MTKNIHFSCGFAAFVASTGFAGTITSGESPSLLPFQRSVLEITSIIGDPEVLQKIGAMDEIVAVTATSSGYTIRSANCTISVVLEPYDPISHSQHFTVGECIQDE